jgi:hypothetical protein
MASEYDPADQNGPLALTRMIPIRRLVLERNGRSPVGRFEWHPSVTWWPVSGASMQNDHKLPKIGLTMTSAAAPDLP